MSAGQDGLFVASVGATMTNWSAQKKLFAHFGHLWRLRIVLRFRLPHLANVSQRCFHLGARKEASKRIEFNLEKSRISRFVDFDFVHHHAAHINCVGNGV
jgi:hypothetical protein